MNYLIINGSPRKKITYSVIKQVISNFDGNFEEIHLAKEKIPMCNGCYKCIMEGEEYCPHYDIINPIMDKIRKCDGIIIGSPVYSMNVTALLKNFFDHTAYLYHRPQFFTKKALVVVTTAGAGQKKVADYIDENLKYWGVNNIYKLHFACGGKDSLEKDKINKTAKKFARDVESKKMHSPKFSNIISYNVWRAMACCDDPIPADKKYWFDSQLVSQEFAPEVKLNIFKKLFSKFVFFFFRKVFK